MLASVLHSHNVRKLFKFISQELFINFKNFSIHRPQIYENNGSTKILLPQEARLRNFTYSGSMTIDESRPLYSAIGLGIRLSETSMFKDRVLTFHSEPSWVRLNSGDTFCEKVQAQK